MATLQTFLQEALQAPSFPPLFRIISSETLSRVDVKDLKLLRKLCKIHESRSLVEISEFYIRLLSSAQVSNTNLIITLANDALAVSDSLKGSDQSNEIEYKVIKLLSKIVKTSILESSQFDSINQIIQRQDEVLVKSELEVCTEKIKEGDVFGMQLLISVFCGFSSIREQFLCIENDLASVIEAFGSVKTLDMFIQILNFLNTSLVNPIYTISISGELQEFTPNTLRYYSTHRRTFKVFWKIIDIILQTDPLISQNLIKIVPKLWNIFPACRATMIPDILLLLNAIKKSNNSESITAASKFVYSIFTDNEIDAKLKLHLKNEFPLFMHDEGFRFAPDRSQDFESFKINDSFPLLCKIGAGEKFSIKLSVESGCILYNAFVLDAYDIHFSVISQNPLELLFQEKYIKANGPFVSRILCKTSGVLTIEWDNSFSWVNSKQVRYRVMVLFPKDRIMSPLSISEDLANVVIYQDNLVIASDEIREEIFEYSSILECVREFMVKYKRKGANILIMAEEEQLKLSEIENAAFGVDIEVVAKYVCESYKENCVVVVSDKPQGRSCLCRAGRIINGVAEIQRINKGIFEGLAVITQYFSEVAIVFYNCYDIESLRREAKEKGLHVLDLDIDPDVIVTQLRRYI